jgi:hypothetical protein
MQHGSRNATDGHSGRAGGRAILTRAIVVRAVCLGTFPLNLKEMCVGGYRVYLHRVTSSVIDVTDRPTPSMRHTRRMHGQNRVLIDLI